MTLCGGRGLTDVQRNIVVICRAPKHFQTTLSPTQQKSPPAQGAIASGANIKFFAELSFKKAIEVQGE